MSAVGCIILVVVVRIVSPHVANLQHKHLPGFSLPARLKPTSTSATPTTRLGARLDVDRRAIIGPHERLLVAGRQFRAGPVHRGGRRGAARVWVVVDAGAAWLLDGCDLKQAVGGVGGVGHNTCVLAASGVALLLIIAPAPGKPEKVFLNSSIFERLVQHLG